MARPFNVLLRGTLALLLAWGSYGYAMRGIHTASQEHAVTQWPTITGKVRGSHAETVRAGRGSVRTAFITYTYNVDGRSFASDRLTFAFGVAEGIGDMLGAPPDSVVARYPAGSAVVVHYNPEDPSEAVLFPGHSGNQVILNAVVAVILMVGTFLALTAKASILQRRAT